MNDYEKRVVDLALAKVSLNYLLLGIILGVGLGMGIGFLIWGMTCQG